MPIPNPDKNENNQLFVARCMGDEKMQKEYPDAKQRIAVCLGQTKSSLVEQVCEIIDYSESQRTDYTDDLDEDEEEEELKISNLFIPGDNDYINVDEPIEEFDPYTISSEYQGRKVSLNKPFRTPDAKKKFAVYVRNKEGKVIIVWFGSQEMSIKRDDPARRKSFRARHKCDQQKDKTTRGYWSCYQWRSNSPVAD